MSTSKTGNHDSGPVEAAHLPLTALILGIAGLLLAVYIGSQVLGILVAILFPPDPPLAGGAALVSHTSSEHGLDDWVYTIAQNPCDVLVFYQEVGAECDVVPASCAEAGTRQFSPNQSLARCSGVMSFSIFAMRWDAGISSGQQSDQTDLHLSREIFWTGAVPPRQFPLPESSDLGDN